MVSACVVLQAAWLRERKLQHPLSVPAWQSGYRAQSIPLEFELRTRAIYEQTDPDHHEKVHRCYCLNWRWQPVSASSRIFPTIFPLTYLRFHQFASIHQSCTAKRHCTDWRPLHPVWSSVVLVQQSQRKLLSDVALLLQSARALWLIISSWILGSTDSLRLMRTCVCGQHGMSKKKTELSKNRAELEFQSVHSSGSLPRRFRSTVCVAPIVAQGYQHVWCIWPREGPHVVALCRGLCAQSYLARRVPMQAAAIHWTPAETIPCAIYAMFIVKNSKDIHHARKGPHEL